MLFVVATRQPSRRILPPTPSEENALFQEIDEVLLFQKIPKDIIDEIKSILFTRKPKNSEELLVSLWNLGPASNNLTRKEAIWLKEQLQKLRVMDNTEIFCLAMKFVEDNPENEEFVVLMEILEKAYENEDFTIFPGKYDEEWARAICKADCRELLFHIYNTMGPYKQRDLSFGLREQIESHMS